MTQTVLLDRYHRVINYLRVSVTDRCNLRCAYCMPEEGVRPLDHAEVLSYEEILRVARVAVRMGIHKVRITGGEPMVRRGLLGFLGELAAIPGIRDLSLTTNGVLLAGMARDLRAAGLRRVNVSLDTLRPERFERITRRPGLERVVEGIRAARAAGLEPVKVNVVAMRGFNDDEILDFVDFARQEGVEVRFIEFMPAGGAWDRRRVVPAAEILDTLLARHPFEPAGRETASGPSRTYRLPDGTRVGVISPLSDHFCGTCNRLRLTAAGRLRTCLFSDREVDLRRVLRSGADDRALEAVLRAAVAQKPEGHGMAADAPCGADRPTMSRVGG